MILAVLAIGIAIAAVWGYTTIKEEASKLAKEAALEAAKATVGAFLEGPDFRDALKSVVGDGDRSPKPIGEPERQLKPYPKEETK